MVAEQQAMTNLSSDLANLRTPGFLSLVTRNLGDPVGSVFRVGGHAHHATAPVALTPPIAQGVAAMSGFSTVAGAAVATGVPSDVAISGGGFLRVQTPHGAAYTRNGALHVSPTGVLTSAAGYPVLSAAGTPIRLQGRLPWTVHPSGRITQAGRPAQQLAVHTLHGTLTDLGHSTYQGKAGAWRGVVQAGSLIQSNVTVTGTLTNLAQAQASYAANADVFNEESTRLTQMAALAQLPPVP